MIFYHGSVKKLQILKRQQARSREDVAVPGNELLNAIYFTPDIGFAIAVASMPEGLAEIDDKNHKITFENPNLFDPEKEIFIYEIDSENIPETKLKKVDDLQYAIDADEIVPERIQELKAEEVLKYYELTNWVKKESEKEFKLK